MAYSKAHRFPGRDYHFSLLCKALSHPARIVILRKLMSSQEDKLPFGALTSGLPLVQSSVSRHIKMLRDMQIVRCEGSGPETCYWVNPDLVTTVMGLRALLTQTESGLISPSDSETLLLGGRRTIGAVPL